MEGRSMRILVCVKQVADIESNLRINKSLSWIDENERIAFRMNRYDEYALEEALLIKDSSAGVVVETVSVGPERSVSTVKKSLERGADMGFHIKCDNPAISAFETASFIAEFAADREYDLIFAGVMSEDLMQSQVGPVTAAILGIPCASSVVKSELINDHSSILAEIELEGGMTEKVEITLPAVITVQTGVNLPRYPSLSNVMRARSLEVITIDSKNLKSKMSREKIISVNYPPVSSKGIVIEGSSDEKAGKLLDLFHERALI